MARIYRRFNIDNPPPPIMTSDPDSFAYKTMTTRIPQVVQNVIADHRDTYPARFIEALQELHDEIVENRPVAPLYSTAPDEEDWRTVWSKYQNRTWLDIPWFFAEAYFYRRLLEAVNYFGDDEWAGVDPYLPRKQAELAGPAPWQMLEAALEATGEDSPHRLYPLLNYAVWGNRVDLSYTQVTEQTGRDIVLENEAGNLIVDESDEAVQYLEDLQDDNLDALDLGERGESIQILCDNAGAELLTDLALADFFLRGSWADMVILHVKAYPTFVSDATVADVQMSLEALAGRSSPRLKSLGDRLRAFKRQGRLLIQADSFWNSAHFFWELPPTLEAELGRAGLVIIKGDANYRRLLGDSRVWDPTTPLFQAALYFPAPFLVLRTMKSDPIVGLPPGKAEQLDAQDPHWRVNGQRGVIQFCDEIMEEL